MSYDQDTSFRSKAVESVFSLPLCIVFATLLWVGDVVLSAQPLDLASLLSPIASYLLTLLTVFVMAEADNTLGLLRIRTTLLPCVWLMLTAVQPELHQLSAPHICSLCVALGLSLLLRCYQRVEPVGWVFHAFLCLGLGSLMFPPLLCLGLLFFLCLHAFMQALTPRTVAAGLVGIVFPYLVWAGICLWNEDATPLLGHFDDFWPSFSWATHPDIPFSRGVLWCVTLPLTLVGIVFYTSQSYADKIRVRMMHFACISQTLILLVAALMHPLSGELFSILQITASLHIAYFFSFARGRVVNVLFVLTLLLLVFVALQELVGKITL